jgi:hypothetical protein
MDLGILAITCNAGILGVNCIRLLGARDYWMYRRKER